jgi:ribosome-associated protein
MVRTGDSFRRQSKGRRDLCVPMEWSGFKVSIADQENLLMIHITDAVTLDEREVKERFVRASGPRGVNVDKDATGVELRLDLARSSLPQDVKDRLIAIGRRHLTSTGVLMVVARADRSQVQNRSAAHARLLALLARAAIPAVERKPTTPTAATRRKRQVAKERRSAVKRSRGQRDGDV